MSDVTTVLRSFASIVQLKNSDSVATVGVHYASWEDSRYSKGERTMKVKVKSCC
jgi:hypothetical protein